MNERGRGRRRALPLVAIAAGTLAVLAPAFALAQRPLVVAVKRSAHVIPWLPLRPRPERPRALAPPCAPAALTPRFGLNGATGSL